MNRLQRIKFWLCSLFHKDTAAEEDDLDWTLRMKMFLLRRRHIRFIKDDELFKVNQELTQQLIDHEQMLLEFLEEEDKPYHRRCQLVAQQLQELCTLRNEIKEVYAYLDRKGKE